MDSHITSKKPLEWYIDDLRETIAYDCRVTNTNLTIDSVTKLTGVDNNPEGISGEANVNLTRIPWSEIETIYGQFDLSSQIDATDIGSVVAELYNTNHVRLYPKDIVYLDSPDPKTVRYQFTDQSIYTGVLTVHIFEVRVPTVEYIGTGTLYIPNNIAPATVYVDGVKQKLPGTVAFTKQHVLITDIKVSDGRLGIPSLSGTIHRLIKVDIGGYKAIQFLGDKLESIDPEFLYMDDGAELSGIFAAMLVTGQIPRMLNRKCQPYGVSLTKTFSNTKMDPSLISDDFLEGFGSIVSIAGTFYSCKFTKPWDATLKWFEPYKESIENISELFSENSTSGIIKSLPERALAGWSNLRICQRAFAWIRSVEPFSGVVFDGVYNNPIDASSMFSNSNIFKPDAELMTSDTLIRFEVVDNMYASTNLKNATEVLKAIVRTSKDTVTSCKAMFYSSQIETTGDAVLEFSRAPSLEQMFYGCKSLEVLPEWKTNPDGTPVSALSDSAKNYAYQCVKLKTLLPVHIPRAKDLTLAFQSIGTSVTGTTQIALGYIPNETVIASSMYFSASNSSDDDGSYVDWSKLDHSVLERCDMLLMHSKVKNLKHFRLNLSNNPNVVNLSQLFSSCTELAVYPIQPFFAEIVNPVIGSGIFANTGLEGRSLESLVAREHITYTWHLPPKDKLPLLQGNVSDIYSGCRILTKLQDIDFEDPDFFKLLGGFKGLLNVENNDDFKRLMELTQTTSPVNLRTSYGLGGYGEYRWAQAAEQKLVTQYAIPQFSTAFAHSPPTDREVMGEFKSVNTPASTTFCRVGLLEKLQEVLDAGTLDNTSGDFGNLIPLLGNVVYTVTKFTKDTCDFLPTTSTVIYVVHDTPLTDPNFLSWVTASEQHFYIRD